MNGPANYRHDLGNGRYLNAFSVDPKLSVHDLKEKVLSKDGKANLDLANLASTISFVAHKDSLAEFGAEAVDQDYQVPTLLQPYRSALPQKLDAVRRQFNGSIAIVQPPLRVPIKFFRWGRYYDYQATSLASDAVPGRLLPELLGCKVEDLFIKRFPLADTEQKFQARYDPRLLDRFRANGSLDNYLESKNISPLIAIQLKEKTIGKILEDNPGILESTFDVETEQIRALQKAGYPAEKTVKQILTEAGLGIESAARYLAFSFIMQTNNGKELSFVYRSPNVGIAADCIAISGSTPPFAQEIFQPGFNMGFYESPHLASQMDHEYGLKEGEFQVSEVYAFDDRDSIPYLSMEIKTPVTTEEIARRIFGNQRAINEHPILFSVPLDAVDILINRFPVLPPVAFTLDQFNRNRNRKV